MPKGGVTPKVTNKHSPIRSQSMINQLVKFQAINDQDLQTATGGGFGLTMAWGALNVVTCGLPMQADLLLNDCKIYRAVRNF